MDITCFRCTDCLNNNMISCVYTIYTYIYICVYIYSICLCICICICICTCICICICICIYACIWKSLQKVGTMFFIVFLSSFLHLFQIANPSIHYRVKVAVQRFPLEVEAVLLPCAQQQHDVVAWRAADAANPSAVFSSPSSMAWWRKEVFRWKWCRSTGSSKLMRILSDLLFDGLVTLQTTT